MQLIFVWVVAPLLIAFYETDPSAGYAQRVWTSTKVQLPFYLILILLTVPTFYWVNEVTLNQAQCTFLKLDPNTTDE